MGFSQNGSEGRQQPLLAVEKAGPAGVTQESVKRTSAQGPGLGYPAPPSPLITSPFTGRRVYQSEEARTRGLRLMVAISCCIMFADGFYATQLFPYVSFMTEELRDTPVKLGVYTGLLYTSQSAGMLLSAFIWARASNKYGRRICLLAGLSFACCTTVIMAFSSSYWFTASIRLLSGLLNNNLSIVRTALRERFQREGAEDTEAFSMLSVAFGASSVAGPSFGGLLYGLLPKGAFGAAQPWTAPMLTCTSLYSLSLILSIFWLPETADLKLIAASQQAGASVGAAGKPAGSTPLLRNKEFLLLLVMAGGHSYTFTGWELVYPLFARTEVESGGEGWNTQLIGATFMVGSVGLMCWSLTLFSRLARKVPIAQLWVRLWVLPVIMMPIFPRSLPLLLERGLGPQSPAVLSVNYVAQLAISVLVGSQFISVQLLINGFCEHLPNGASMLALANGYLVSCQALVRATSPLTTGYLFTLGMHERITGSKFLSEAIAFDHLALVALVCCIVCAMIYNSRMQKQ